jgi:hypothetical protein
VTLTEYEGARAYELVKKRAERVIKENITAFKQAVAATMEYEMIMMGREMQNGNDYAANSHRLRAKIYQSLLLTL